MKNIKRKILQYGMTKFYYTKFIGSGNGLNILDIGLDNNSVEKARLVFPCAARYDGLDIVDPISNFRVDNFYKVNLDSDDCSQVPASFYDLIICNHVLEHLSSGERAIELLLSKLKNGGHIYIEFPNYNSLRGAGFFSYHFHQDPTHKKIYDPKDICNLLMKNGMEIQSSGYAKNVPKILYGLLKSIPLILLKRPVGSQLAHFRNKISYVLAIKKVTLD